MLSTCIYLYHWALLNFDTTGYALNKPFLCTIQTVSFLPSKLELSNEWFISSLCVSSLSLLQLSDSLKLLYYSPGVCQIPQQPQTHHPSLALCLRGNKVLGFPGWQICVIVPRSDRENNPVDRGGEQRRKGMREGLDAGREVDHFPFFFQVKIEFLWTRRLSGTEGRRPFL